jgi:PAS domain S-box-containing protein
MMMLRVEETICLLPRPGLLGLSLALALALASAPCDALGADRPPLPTLTNAQQVIDLGLDGTRVDPHPVHLRAVITYPSPLVPNRLYVQDASAGIQVAATPLGFAAEPGQVVEIDGVATRGAYYNFVNNADIRLVGSGPVPVARTVTAIRLAAGGEFAQWVSLKVLVLDVAVAMNRVWLMCSENGHTFLAWVTLNSDIHLPTDWLDSIVELRGVTWTFFDDRNQPSGFRFHVPGTNYVTIIKPGRPDIFARPSVPIGSLRGGSPGSNARVKVTGVVTYAAPSGLCYLQDDSGAASAQALHPLQRDDARGKFAQRAELPPLAPGDRVELVGLPLAGAFLAPSLAHAEYRIIGRGPAPVAQPVSGREAASGDWDGRLVTLQARLVDRETTRDGALFTQTLWLHAGEGVFEARYQGKAPELFAAEKDGLFDVTGVCEVRGGELQHARAFRLHLRGAHDVTSVSEPPVWLSSAALRTVGIAAGLVVVSLAWVGLLRRQVSKRTAELHETAERLRESEERFSKAFRGSSVALAILDAASGRYHDVNDTFVKSYGFSREELIGRTSLEVGLWRDSAQRAEAYRLYEKNGCLRDFESYLRTRDGESRVVLQSGDLITIGQRPSILSVGLDITDRKRAEADLQRTLDQEKELSQLKTNFVSVVSHEFRTPLEVIVSSADILDRYLDRLQPAERDQHLAAIQSSVKRMAEMMEEVLLLGRFESGRLRCAPDDLHLPAFCKRLADEMRSAINGRCLIGLTLAEFPALVRADETLLRHILTNLLSNAVKYSPPGAEVEFQVGRSGRDAVFRVLDHGIGIPVADQARLFEAFHRAGNVGTVPGNGLGLHIVKRCVDLHGGTIELLTETGRGTTFTVRLPLFELATEHSDHP